MALLDFREIASANRSFNSKQAIPIGVSSSVDDFELFAQEFFTSVKKMRIFKSVSNGPDQGMDLGVTDSSGFRWLVSCKHYAHMDKPVPLDKDFGVLEKTLSWECDGFIAFYTTIPSATLDKHLDGAEKGGIKVERYTKDRIESELLASSTGTQIAARYFPKSMTNHYGNLIKTVDEYDVNDVVIINGVARLANFSIHLASDDADYVLRVKERLTYDANIYATILQHRPYFTAAITDAVDLAPSYFQADSTLAQHFSGLAPTWDAFRLSQEESLERIYYVCAAWAFWDWYDANLIFAKTMAIRSFQHLGKVDDEESLLSLVAKEEFEDQIQYQKTKGLLNIGLLSHKLPEQYRNVLGRLFLFGQA